MMEVFGFEREDIQGKEDVLQPHSMITLKIKKMVNLNNCEGEQEQAGKTK